MATTTHSTTTIGPRLLGTADGYVLDGDRFLGFEDRPDLPDGDRVLIAQWTARYSAAGPSEEQRRLLESNVSREVSPTAAERVGKAIEDAEVDLPHALSLGLYDLLSEDELEAVRFPSRHSELKGRSYPLGVNDLAKLTGASPKQIRHWDDLGLLPGYRDGDERRFLSAAAVSAVALKRLDPYQVGALAFVVRGDQKLGDFLPLFGRAVAFAARRITGEPGRELTRAAEQIARYGALLIDEVSPKPKGRKPSSPRQVTRRSTSSGKKANDRATKLFATKGTDNRSWALRATPTGRQLGSFKTLNEVSGHIATRYKKLVTLEIRSGKSPRRITVDPARPSVRKRRVGQSSRRSSPAKRPSAKAPARRTVERRKTASA